MTGVSENPANSPGEHEGGAAHDSSADARWRGGRGRGEPGLSAARQVLLHQPLHSTALNCTPSSWEEEARSQHLFHSLYQGSKTRAEEDLRQAWAGLGGGG